jgi:hypothetical protein
MMGRIGITKGAELEVVRSLNLTIDTWQGKWT